MKEKKPPKEAVRCSEEVLNAIYDRVACGESLLKICQDPKMPSRKCFYEWVGNDATIKTRYEFAMLMRADAMAEETIRISDDGSNDTYIDENGKVKTDHDVVSRARLRVDTRKWYISKIAPKKYGDRVVVEGAGKNGEHMHAIANLTDEELLRIASSGE